MSDDNCKNHPNPEQQHRINSLQGICDGPRKKANDRTDEKTMTHDDADFGETSAQRRSTEP